MGACTSAPNDHKINTNHVYSKYSYYDSQTVILIIHCWNHRYNSKPSHLCERIQSLIQLFAQTEDKFDQSVTTTQCIKISNMGLTVKKSTRYSNNWQSGTGFAFGSYVVNKDQCTTWKLQITGQEAYGWLWPGIGICANNEIHKFSKKRINKSKKGKILYTLGWNGRKYIGYKDEGQYCDKLKLHDIIEMTLDMKESTLSFVLNDKDLGVMCKIDNSTKYRMYVCMAHRTEITILDTCS